MDMKQVHSPKHYTEGRNIEPWDTIRDWDLNFNLGSAVKYIARAGRKDDLLQDLYKAKEYLEKEISCIEAEREPEESETPVRSNALESGVIALDDIKYMRASKFVDDFQHLEESLRSHLYIKDEANGSLWRVYAVNCQKFAECGAVVNINCQEVRGGGKFSILLTDREELL